MCRLVGGSTSNVVTFGAWHKLIACAIYGWSELPHAAGVAAECAGHQPWAAGRRWRGASAFDSNTICRGFLTENVRAKLLATQM